MFHTSVLRCLLLFQFFYVSFGKNFRSDYTYHRKTDAFYKFHIESEGCRRASFICGTEAASLLFPASDADLSIVHGMYKKYPDISENAWVEKRDQHESEEEKPLINFSDVENPVILEMRYMAFCAVVSRDGDLQQRHGGNVLPFFCKVNARDAYYDPKCKVYGKNYEYFENVGSCYKIPPIAYSWNQAYDECLYEGSHLVILNSELEHEVVKNLTNAAIGAIDSKTPWSFWAGIRAAKPTDGSPVVFKTIFNQTLEETGFSQWSANEPNNYGGVEYCGSIFKNDGKYNDLECSHYYGFVCEKEIDKSI